MATYKIIQESTLPHIMSHLTCDSCGSTDIASTIEGYVCRTCGIVLEIQKLRYDRPYNNDIIQYAKGLGKTQIGTLRERTISPDFKLLHRLNKHNIRSEYEEEVLQRARDEISRIFTCFNLEDYYDAKDMVFQKFREVRKKLRPGIKYRNVEKLVDIITYFCLKLRNISINYSHIIKNSTLSKKEFNDFYLQVRRYLPKYKDRNRQEYILQRVLEVSWYFNLGIPFYYQAKKILFKMWEGIKNTTDNVLAGLVGSISVLCSKTYKDKVKVNSICDYLDIRMSTIQSQVRKKIFERFNIEGFVSLVKSSGLLTRVFETLGLMKAEKKDSPEEEHRVELVFGNAAEIFTQHEDMDYYFFTTRNENNSSTVVYIQVYHPLMNFEDGKKSKKKRTQDFLKFDIVNYYKGKDPPVNEP